MRKSEKYAGDESEKKLWQVVDKFVVSSGLGRQPKKSRAEEVAHDHIQLRALKTSFAAFTSDTLVNSVREFYICMQYFQSKGSGW